MKVLIIIPAYNEANNLPKLIEDIKNAYPHLHYIIVNDCSTDNTEGICNKFGYNYISLPFNLGIGGAVQTGYAYAKKYNYDIAIQIDGDGQHDISYINKLIDLIRYGNVDFVVGSRYINNEGFQSTFMRRLGIRYFSKLILLLTKQHFTDPTSGLRAGNREVIEYFAMNYPRDYPEPESIMALCRKGYAIAEIPVKMKSRNNGTSSISQFKAFYYMIKVSIAILVDFTKNNSFEIKG